MPRYLIIFAFAFGTPMLNLIRQRKDHLPLRPCRLPQRKTNLDSIFRWYNPSEAHCCNFRSTSTSATEPGTRPRAFIYTTLVFPHTHFEYFLIAFTSR